MAIGKWYIDAEVNMSSVRKETSKLKKELKKSGDYIENDIGKRGNKAVSGLSSSFKKLGGILAGIFAVGAIVGFTKKLFQLGSDATEIGSKFDTVFGGIEKVAGQTFDNLAQAVGRSSLELRKFGSDLGDVLKPLGFTTDEAFKLSENITKLAIDVASFNNVSDAQAINSFRSALTGERESLKSLGIVISEADLKTEAYTSGIAKQGSALSKQQKALATYNLLLKNTSDAQGDAVRTGGSFANQLKRLQGVITDVLASSGRDIAQQSSIVLVTLGTFIKKYGKAIIGVLINTTKSIGDIIVTSAKGFKSLFDIILQNTGKVEKDQIKFTTIMLHLFNAVGNGINALKTIFLSLGTIAGGIFKGITDTGYQVGQAIFRIVNAMKLLTKGDLKGAKESILSIKKLQKGVIKNIKSTTQDTTDIIKNQWGNLTSDIQKGLNNINNDIVSGGKTTLDDYSTSFDSLTGIADKYSKLGGTIDKSNNKNSGSINKTKNKLSQLKDEYNNVGDKIKKLKKLSEDYSNSSNKYDKDILDSVRKINKELENRKNLLSTEIKNIESESKNQLADRYVTIKEREKEVSKQIIELEKKRPTASMTTEDFTKLNDLEKEKIKLLKERQTIESNVNNKTLIEAQRVAGLNETQRILEEEKLKKEQAQKDFDREKAKLDSLLKINNAFLQIKQLDQKQLDDFQKAETFKNWSTEEQELFLKLAREKVSLTEQADYKLSLERQINNEIINLSNTTMQAQLDNNLKLNKSYNDLISKINLVIAKQRQLSASKNSNGFKNGGFTGYSSGGFTGSGDSNKVAGVVHAGEWVAPSWMLDSLGPVFNKLETMRSSGNTTKTINKTQNNNITVNSQFEAENFLDYANWKL